MDLSLLRRCPRLMPLALGFMVVSCLGDHPPEIVLEAFPLEAGWIRTYSRITSVEILDGGGGRLTLVDGSRVTSLGVVGVDDRGTAIMGLGYERTVGGSTITQEEWFTQDARSLRRVIPGPGLIPGEGDPGESPSRLGLAGMLRAVVLEGLDGLIDENTFHTLLSYPLEPGNSWVARSRHPVVVRRVDGFETVTVPAGRFRAVRLVTQVLTEPPIEYVDWIASAGLVRREVDVRVDAFLAPAHPAQERIVELVELESLRRP